MKITKELSLKTQAELLELSRLSLFYLPQPSTPEERCLPKNSSILCLYNVYHSIKNDFIRQYLPEPYNLKTVAADEKNPHYGSIEFAPKNRFYYVMPLVFF